MTNIPDLLDKAADELLIRGKYEGLANGFTEQEIWSDNLVLGSPTRCPRFWQIPSQTQSSKHCFDVRYRSS